MLVQSRMAFHVHGGRGRKSSKGKCGKRGPRMDVGAHQNCPASSAETGETWSETEAEPLP